MAYIELKEKLEKLLSEDLSNRTTLQETRRNLFLNHEGKKVQQQLISQKETEINNLTLLVEKKKTIVQLKDDEIAVLRNQIQELNEKFTNAEQSFENERQNFAEKLQDTNQLNELSLQNESYANKIRELIYHIDSLNTEIENLKKETASTVNTSQLEEKLNDYERLSEKATLLAASEQQLKMLVSSQNTEIELYRNKTNELKNKANEIAAGWQQQYEQLLIDNATLQADLAILNKEHVELKSSTEVTSEVDIIKQEKEHLLAELQIVKHDLNVTAQQRDEKVISLQTEITNLLAEITLLRENIYAETEEKQALNSQLQHLTTIVSEKEQQLNTVSEKTDADTFIEKLLNQVNLLNNEKLTFETLYQDKAESLQEVNDALVNLTQVVENQKNAISGLEQTNKNIKLAQTLMLQVKDKTAAKQAINELVREIDKCIALLSE